MIEGKKCWVKVFKRIKFAKLGPMGLDGMEVAFYHPGEMSDTEGELHEDKDYIRDLDTDSLFKFLKQHVLTEPNQICFARTCWKIYRLLK